jgi:hypothetical protein
VSREFQVLAQERAYTRRGLLAVELLDSVTLSRVSDGVRVVAEGLSRPVPSLNSSGLFVWLGADVSTLVKVSIDPRQQPFERVELLPGDLNLPPLLPLTTIELPPRLDYPFTAGITAARGTLIETRVLPSETPTPVAGADMRLRWLDEDGTTWRDAPMAARTTSNGDFVVVLRLTPAEVPFVDATGQVTVRLSVRRSGASRESGNFKLPQGRVADPATLNTLIVPWDELL